MASARYDVLGIGNAIVDVIARTEEDFLLKQGMNKGTMALIDAPRAEAIYEAMGPAIEFIRRFRGEYHCRRGRVSARVRLSLARSGTTVSAALSRTISAPRAWPSPRRRLLMVLRLRVATCW